MNPWKVLDQYLSFISPSPSLFSLIPPPNTSTAATPNAVAGPSVPSVPHSTYAILNSPASTEQQIEEEIERVATGLFSVVVTMGKSRGSRGSVALLTMIRPCPYHPRTSRKRCRDDCEETRAEDSRRHPLLCTITHVLAVRTRRVGPL